MKFVGLISGGKDSIFNLLQCIAYGHELVCVANLHPPANQEEKEIDSFMFQTVGVEITDYIAQCLEVPVIKLYKNQHFYFHLYSEIRGKSVNQELYYEKDENSKLEDEVEDLYQLISMAKSQYPDIQAVASGAIFSNYQRLRVENICQRLGLVSLAYLWLRDQSELLKEMIDCQMDARIIKICSMGLKQAHLGKSIASLYDYFITLRDKFQFNVCGEGGEYETAVFDCPIFKNKKIVEVQSDYVYHSQNEIGPVAYLRLNKLELKEKEPHVIQHHQNIMQELIEKKKFKPQSSVNDLLPSFQKETIKIQTPENKLQTIEQPFFLRNGNLLFTRYLNITDFGIQNSPDKQFTQAEEVKIIFEQINDILKPFDMGLKQNAFAVSLLISDMSKFAEINSYYVQYFGLKPPVRACVALPHNQDVFKVQIQVSLCDTFTMNTKRFNLHVQSISQWAPSNIGPYSQANKINGNVFIAGQIGLVPDHMVLPQAFEEQYFFIKRNFNAILDQVAQRTIPSSSISKENGIVYIEKMVDFTQFKSKILNDFPDIPLVLLRCEKLPRNCLLEIELFCNQEKSLFKLTGDKENQTIIQQSHNIDSQQEESKKDDSNNQYIKIFNQIQPEYNIEDQLNNQFKIMMNEFKAFIDKKYGISFVIYGPINLVFNDNLYLQQLIFSKAKEFCDPVISFIPVHECEIINFHSKKDSIVWTAQFMAM